MKKNSNSTPGIPHKNVLKPNILDRRKFVGLISATALGFTIVPRHVLGGPGFVAPSDKITLAYIGCGTQGLRELMPLLPLPDLQITAVCDPNETATGYRDWGKTWLRDEIRKTIKMPDWTPGGDNTIPGGLANGKFIVDTYYAKQRQNDAFRACSAYTDFRELLEKEKDLDAVKVMTPDHLHGIAAMAAIKRGKHISMHKPLSNRLMESHRVIEMASSSKVTTHLVPWEANMPMDTALSLIRQGAIGTLKEIHNWSNRPVWPQYPTLPVDTPPVPKGFNWDLWLGPEAYRPYHPDYTHMVFRGWYDFGGGAMADMGHYSLWSVFNAFDLSGPTIIEPQQSHVCSINEPVPFTVKNDFSFPMATTVRFRYPAKNSRGPIDLVWHDGGMRPPIPDEMIAENKELGAEGMMFVGDKGMMVGNFYGEKLELYPKERRKTITFPPPPKQNSDEEESTQGFSHFLKDLKQGKQTPGSFKEAIHLSETINLYAVALRTGKLLKYDAQSMKITNNENANKYLDRTYRPGWKPEEI
jgi:hypothetical protein